MKPFKLILTALVLSLLSFYGKQIYSRENTVKNNPSELENFYLDLARQMGSQAWLVYQRKLLQLLETYSYETDEEALLIEYVSEEKSSCPVSNESNLVYEIAVSRDQGDRESSTFIKHLGCGRDLVSELIVISGENTSPLSGLAVFTGVRPFHVTDKKGRLLYIVSNAFEEVLFSIEEIVDEGSRYFFFKIKDEIVFEMYLDNYQGHLNINFNSFEGEWRFGKHGRWRVNFSGSEVPSFQIMERALGTIQVREIISREYIGLNDFRGFFTGFTLQMVDIAINQQIQRLDQDFMPRSEFLSTGASGDRLREELIRLIERIQANDTQTVIAELLQLIEAIEQGQIRDLR